MMVGVGVDRVRPQLTKFGASSCSGAYTTLLREKAVYAELALRKGGDFRSFDDD